MRARSSVRPAKGTASDNAAAPGCRSRPPWGRLSRPAPGSCGNRQRRHPPHIEDEADEAPFPLRLREPAHRDGAEAEYLLVPPVDRLHDRLAPLEPPSAFVGLQLPTSTWSTSKTDWFIGEDFQLIQYSVKAGHTTAVGVLSKDDGKTADLSPKPLLAQ